LPDLEDYRTIEKYAEKLSQWLPDGISYEPHSPGADNANLIRVLNRATCQTWLKQSQIKTAKEILEVQAYLGPGWFYEDCIRNQKIEDWIASVTDFGGNFSAGGTPRRKLAIDWINNRLLHAGSTIPMKLLKIAQAYGQTLWAVSSMMLRASGTDEAIFIYILYEFREAVWIRVIEYLSEQRRELPLPKWINLANHFQNRLAKMESYAMSFDDWLAKDVVAVFLSRPDTEELAKEYVSLLCETGKWFAIQLVIDSKFVSEEYHSRYNGFQAKRESLIREARKKPRLDEIRAREKGKRIRGRWKKN